MIPAEIREQRRREIAAVVAQFPEGATLAEVMAVTGLPRWEADTRLAGAVNTGLLHRRPVRSRKNPNGGRVPLVYTPA